MADIVFEVISWKLTVDLRMCATDHLFNIVDAVADCVDLNIDGDIILSDGFDTLCPVIHQVVQILTECSALQLSFFERNS